MAFKWDVLGDESSDELIADAARDAAHRWQRGETRPALFIVCSAFLALVLPVALLFLGR